MRPQGSTRAEGPVVDAWPEAVGEAPADPWLADGSETHSGAPETALDSATQTPPKPEVRNPATGDLGASDL